MPSIVGAKMTFAREKQWKVTFAEGVPHTLEGQHQHMAAAAGERHSAAVGEDGSLFVWGDNRKGQIGKGRDCQRRRAPRRIEGCPPVRQVAAGGEHTGIVTDAGDLLMCGLGGAGQLGLGNAFNQTRPVLVERALFDDDAVLMVACGDEHTAALTEGGGVYTFGLGEDGQLGHGDTEDQLAPRRVPAAGFNGERVVMVAAGRMHTAALSEAGHVYTWGDGGVGQLGHDDWNSHRAPRRVEPGRFGGERVVFVAAGGNQTVAVTAGGRLYTWGYGGHGRLGHGDTGNRLVPTLVGAGAFGGSAVVMAACGDQHTLVVTCDGALWACGCGEDGRLGLGYLMANRRAFERVGVGQFGGARIVAAAAGGAHSVALSEHGALWTWGDGTEGRLGHGDEDDWRVPTLVARAGLGGGQIGRCRALPAEHALAFAMGTHGRLGGGGGASSFAPLGVEGLPMVPAPTLQGTAAASPCLSLKDELVGMIVRLSVSWPAGSAGEQEGVVRLLGGGAEAGRAVRAWPAMALQAVASD